MTQTKRKTKTKTNGYPAVHNGYPEIAGKCAERINGPTDQRTNLRTWVDARDFLPDHTKTLKYQNNKKSKKILVYLFLQF